MYYISYETILAVEPKITSMPLCVCSIYFYSHIVILTHITDTFIIASVCW